ncbi:MAG: glutamate racemase [Candidatus Margulisiibacteriota bacterium]
MHDNRPIGIYDSGIGGLSVLNEIKKQLPNESVVYYGDTMHLPYGDKSQEEILVYNTHIFALLIEQNCKMVISACNTSSSLALDTMTELYPYMPTVGLIRPGSLAALNTTKNKKIGVIATKATILSNSYKNTIQQFSSAVEVQQVACPAFVPLIESGNLNSPEMLSAVKRYIAQLHGIDTLILGCTHYPLLEPILKTIPKLESVSFIDPAVATVARAKSELDKLKLTANNTNKANYTFIWSGHTPTQFNEIEYKTAEAEFVEV